jgi:hypothetical protein
MYCRWMQVNLEESGRPHTNNWAKHNALQISQQTYLINKKNATSAETRVGYDAINLVGNRLTRKRVNSLVKLKQLLQLSISILNIT